MTGKRPNLAVVLNSSIALGFLPGQLEYFHSKGFSVTVFCPERRHDEWQVAWPTNIATVTLPMERKIAPVRDLVSLWRLWRAFRVVRPTVTNVGTPKAGLLGGFAAWLNRIPCRFYTLHGLRFETTSGLKRTLLVHAERLACRFAHRVVCVSHSVREKAIAFGLAPPDRTVVFGSGSCNGLDASRFSVNSESSQRADLLRRRLGIPSDATVILFVGRLTRDKGIPELMEAFTALEDQFSNLRLLLVGCCEKEDALPAETRARIRSNPCVIFVGPVQGQDIATYYTAANIVVLPSHREGLPTVILEAQAAGKPVVAASATGIVDLVTDGETGLLFPAGDAEALAHALARLMTDTEFAHKLATAGQQQVQREFQPERIWDDLYRAYFEILQKNAPRSLAPRGSKSKVLLPVSRDY